MTNNGIRAGKDRPRDAAQVLAVTPAEHLRRAADLYALPVSSCYRTDHLLQVMVELGLAIAKAATAAGEVAATGDAPT